MISYDIKPFVVFEKNAYSICCCVHRQTVSDFEVKSNRLNSGFSLYIFYCL